MKTLPSSHNSKLKTQNSKLAMRRIAIFRALFLGDLLCVTPAFRALRQRFPRAEITLIGLPWAADLIKRLPYLDRLEVFPGYPGIAETPYDPARTEAFLAAARGYGYDLALQMHGSGSISNGFVADLGATLSLGYRASADARLTISLPYDEGEHEILRWLRLVNQLQMEADHRQGSTSNLQSAALGLDFPITADEHERAAELIPTECVAPVIGIHPGAKDAERRWPPERFAMLADELAARYGATIVLTGSAGERPITAAVRDAMRYPSIDLAGATDLGVFGAAIARLDLLVSNDTGAAHLAVATGTPSVVIFGPNRPEQWGPLDAARHCVVDSWALAGFAVDGATALRKLPVATVLMACEEMFDTMNGRQPTTKDQTMVVAEQAIESMNSSLVLRPWSVTRRK
jgi:ADP-heptose:LPS heptosyltransferase